MARNFVTDFNLPIDPQFAIGNQGAYDRLHEIYHQILDHFAAARKDDAKTKATTEAINAKRDEWLKTVDLSEDESDLFDSVREAIDGMVYGEHGEVAKLAAIHFQLTKLTALVLDRLKFEAKCVVAPNDEPTETFPWNLEDAKDVRKFGREVVGPMILGTGQSFNEKEWRELPKGRRAGESATGRPVSLRGINVFVDDPNHEKPMRPEAAVKAVGSVDLGSVATLAKMVEDSDQDYWQDNWTLEINGHKLEAVRY